MLRAGAIATTGIATGLLAGLWWKASSKPACAVVRDSRELIGATPLLRIKSLSEETGCEIYGKCEFMNLSGSSKDRIARAIIDEAERSGKLLPGGTIVEASAGSTGISLAQQARARGYTCVLYLQERIVSAEKLSVLRALGAELHVVPIRPLNDRDNFLHLAAKHARETPGCFYADQFNNLANFRAHYDGTAREIVAQLGGRVDGVVMSAGTGGTLAGLSRFCKEHCARPVVAYACDPPGSGVHAWLATGTMFHPDDHDLVQPLEPRSVVEGVGINRLTQNLREAALDGVFQVSDRESVEMAHFLIRDGLWLGGSSALNLCGAVKMARLLGRGHTVVTVLCDGGQRYATKLYNDEWLAQRGLSPTRPSSLDFVLR